MHCLFGHEINPGSHQCVLQNYRDCSHQNGKTLVEPLRALWAFASASFAPSGGADFSCQVKDSFTFTSASHWPEQVNTCTRGVAR